MNIKSRLAVSPMVKGRIFGCRGFCMSNYRHVQYGFIGLGQMGYGMARNLLSNLPASDSLQIFDINYNSIKRFVDYEKRLNQATVNKASNIFEATENSKVIITVLPNSSKVKEVYWQILRRSNISTTRNRNRLFIDCSTIDSKISREIAKAAQEIEGSQYVDAPMSGGVDASNKGTLTFMLGSPDHLVLQVKKILLLMGKKVFHCGSQASGLSGKLANNYLLAINNIATAEAMRIGIKWGLEPRLLSKLINSSTGRCWPSEVNNPVKGVLENAPASRDYEGGFTIGLMKKDLSLAILAAKEAGVQLELAEKAREMYEDADSQEYCNGRDFSVIYKYLEMKDSKPKE